MVRLVASTALPYRPRRLPPLVAYLGWGDRNTRYVLFTDEFAIFRALQNLARQLFFLSADSILEQRLGRLQDCFNFFKSVEISFLCSRLAKLTKLFLLSLTSLKVSGAGTPPMPSNA